MSVTDQLNNTTTYTYDLVGNKLSMTDARGKSRTYTYDDANRLIKATDPTEKYSEAIYDSVSNVVYQTDENGHTTEYTYDALNRLISAADALGNTTSYTYDANGNLTTVRDANNHTTTYAYDELSRLITETDALGYTITYTYDPVGNQLSMTNAKGTWTSTYDDVNRLVKVTDPAGHYTQTIYDGCGNIISRTDANGESTGYSYDDSGRLAEVTDSLENITSYFYDANGNLESITDARGKQRAFAYDAMNRLVSETDSLGKEKTWAYDSAGNLITRTKPGEISINYTYDDNNRLTDVTYPDQSQVSYTYDSTGKRLSMADPNGSTTYTYDENNRLKTIIRDAETITYSYDSAGNITGITYPDGMQVDYSFNELNLLDSATADGQTLNINYNELGQRTDEAMPNGAEVTYQYDQNSRLTLLKHQMGESVLASVYYTMDNNGNRLSITDENNQATNFTYNPLGQLTQVIYPDGKLAQYTYDPVGNRLTTDGDAPDKLDSVIGATYLSYDNEDRLILYQDGTKTIHYTYDGDGNLIRKTVTDSVYGDQEEYQYLYDYSAGLPRLLVEKEGENTYNYVYAGRLYSRIGPDGTIYYHQDGLGSTLAVTDVAGTVKNRYKYDAFGNPTVILETVENSILFTGELYGQSGLIYLKARYYDPAAGRFITQDTYLGELDNPLSQNLYAYCGNSPISYIDPSGRCSQPSTGNSVSYSDPLGLTNNNISGGQYSLQSVLDFLNEVQEELSLIGMAPIIGAYADGLNAGIYASRGDWLNAGISVVACFNVFGDLTTGARLVYRNTDEVYDFIRGASGASGLFRKTSNIGAFKELSEPMQLRHVKKVAQESGIGLDGIKIRIERNTDLVGTGYYGWAHPKGNRIDLYPDAFTGREELVKTLAHERTHIYQTRTLGKAMDDATLRAYENGARAAEKTWMDYLSGF